MKRLVRNAFAHRGLAIYSCDPRLMKNEFAWLADIRTVIDVGAHQGETTSWFRSVFPKARIYAFEPIERYAKTIRGTNIEAANVALDESEGRREFHEVTAETGLSSFYPYRGNAMVLDRVEGNAVTYSVPVTTLDRFFSNYSLDDEILLKLDTQGSEDRILRGGTKLLNRVRVIICEVSFDKTLYEGACLFDDVYRLLFKKGFAYRGPFVTLKSQKFQIARSYMTGETIQEDAIFVRDRM